MTRILSNVIDYQGERVGQLTIGDIVSRVPMRWGATCTDCGTRQTVDHASLVRGIGRCTSSTCGKVDTTESLGQFRKKERDREDRIAARKEEERKGLEDATAARIAAAEAELVATHRKLADTIKKRIQTIADGEFWLDPADVGRSVSRAEQRAYNSEQAQLFMNETPGYYPCAANVNAIGNYLDRNGVILASAATLRAAYLRLREVGLIVDAPPARPAPASVDTDRTDPQLAHMAERDQGYETAPQEYAGFDLQSGRPRSYSEQELAYLTADQYRRAFRIPSAPRQSSYGPWS